MQIRFAVKLFAAAKEMGIHTALDTNGALGDRLSNADLEHIDLVLLDLKGWNPERHRKLTGMENGPVLDFARRLAARKTPLWLRFVLVPGLTDDAADIAQIARFSAELGGTDLCIVSRARTQHKLMKSRLLSKPLRWVMSTEWARGFGFVQAPRAATATGKQTPD